MNEKITFFSKSLFSIRTLIWNITVYMQLEFVNKCKYSLIVSLKVWSYHWDIALGKGFVHYSSIVAVIARIDNIFTYRCKQTLTSGNPTSPQCWQHRDIQLLSVTHLDHSCIAWRNCKLMWYRSAINIFFTSQLLLLMSRVWNWISFQLCAHAVTSMLHAIPVDERPEEWLWGVLLAVNLGFF